MAAVSAAGPAGDCTLRHTRFAEMSYGRSGVLTVELDGCRRIMLGNQLRQGDRGLVTLLAAG